MRTWARRAAVTLALAVGMFCLQATSEARNEPVPGSWPQWRGPARTGISPDTGRLMKWPDDGPPLVWKVQGLGEGVASVAVAGGRIYTLGYQGEDEYVTALDETTGKKVWAKRIGAAVKEATVMRWLSQRTPTVDGDEL